MWADVPSHIAKTAHNALLESWTVHDRALYDFLDLDEPPKPDDIVAGDWFSDGRWTAIRSGPTTELSAARKRVNKDIAHEV